MFQGLKLSSWEGEGDVPAEQTNCQKRALKIGFFSKKLLRIAFAEWGVTRLPPDLWMKARSILIIDRATL
jgi:hypothetical protein